MVNEIDSQLIKELEKNGRASYAELSRAMGISISTVVKKVKYLLDERIITIQAVPNPYRLGQNAQAFIALKTSVDKLENVISILRSYSNVGLVVPVFGRFNLVINVQFETWDSLHNFIAQELSALSDICEMEIFFIKESIKRPYDYFNSQDQKMPVLEVDRIDKYIIEALQVDGRLSLSELALQLKISVSAVSKRLSHLLEENAIRVRSIVDYNKIGFHASAFILIHAKHQQIKDICTQINTLDEIKTIITLISGYNILINAVALDADSLFELINRNIAPIPGVIDIETWVRGKLIKRYYGSLPSKQPLPILTSPNRKKTSSAV